MSRLDKNLINLKIFNTNKNHITIKSHITNRRPTDDQQRTYRRLTIDRPTEENGSLTDLQKTYKRPTEDQQKTNRKLRADQQNQKTPTEDNISIPTQSHP